MLPTSAELFVCHEKFNGFAALCGDRSVCEGPEGGPLPLGWHMLYTHASDPWLKPGSDGHPEQRPEGVPVYLDKRMWAASEVKVFEPMSVGDRLTVEREPPVVSLKQGRSGELAFSNEMTRLLKGGVVAMEEVKTVVYKLSVSGQQPTAKPLREEMPEPGISQPLTLDEISLFKYSAMLGVAHRIHYDYPYATQVEGYQGLVIHGPLLIQLLLNLYRSQYPGTVCARYMARAMRPSYLGMPLTMNLASCDSHVLLWVSNHEGQPTLVINVQS